MKLLDQSIDIFLSVYHHEHLYFYFIQQLSYSFLNFHSPGAVRTIIMVDYEVMPLIIFHVRVTDLGKPRLSSTSLAKVIINIADVNDCGPIFTQASYNASVLIPTYPNIAIIEVRVF